MVRYLSALEAHHDTAHTSRVFGTGRSGNDRQQRRPGNGRRPVNTSYRITPSAQTSVAGPTLLPKAAGSYCSGAMYAQVPGCKPGAVSCVTRTAFSAVSSAVVAGGAAAGAYTALSAARVPGANDRIGVAINRVVRVNSSGCLPYNRAQPPSTR